MSVTPEVMEEILQEFRRTRSPFKVSRALGVPVEEVWKVVDENGDRLQPYAERYDGYGRPELQSFIVARRKANDRSWDNDDPMISQARADYEAGTHEMTTGRDGAWLILYSIPRKRKQPRPDYFVPEF